MPVWELADIRWRISTISKVCIFENILDVGHTADQAAIFTTIATNLNPNQMNIDIRCSDPQVMYQNSRSYPVSISRLGGISRTGAQFLYFPAHPFEMTTMAETINYAQTNYLDWQQQQIGIRTVWCDILLFAVLQSLVSVSATRLSGDWSFSTLNRPMDQPNGQPFQFSMLKFKTATLIMMHELLHSCAAGIDRSYCMSN